jgi:broad specificity phosphatase PhoE
MANRILLFRHLPTVSDDDPELGTLLSGPGQDPEELSPRADAIGNWLRGGALGGRKIDVIHHDSSVRCVRSAEIVAGVVGCMNVFQEDFALRPRRWGDLTGHRWEEVAQVLAQKSIRDRRRYCPPNGESWMDVERRLRGPLMKFVGSGAKSVAVFSHKSIIRIAVGLLIGLDAAVGLDLNPGGFVEIVRDELGWKIEKITQIPDSIV